MASFLMLPKSRMLWLVLTLGLSLGGRTSFAQALVRMTDDRQSIQAADGPTVVMTPEEEDRQIAQYQKEAGQTGLRQWFSQSHVGIRGIVAEAYDDNILVSAGSEKQADAVTTLAVGIGGALGDYQNRDDSYAALDYQATASLFGRHSEQDDVDHVAKVEGQYRWDSLAARIASGFQSLHDISADVGQRIQRYVYDESGTLLYNFGAYTRIEAAVRYNYTNYSTPIDTQDLSGEIGADYEFFDKLRLGGELTIGRTSATGGVAEDYQQFQLRYEYEATGQLKITGRVGAEVRERNGGAGDTVEPVFSLDAEWTPFDGTQLGLGAYRRVSASASASGEDILETGLHFSLRQRLVTRFYVQLDGDYSHGEYQRAIGASGSGPRTDDYYLVRGALGYDFVDWLKVQAFCQRRQDVSTMAQFSFDSTRSGVEVDLAY